MSYSLESKCGTCKKNPECLDGTIIQGAINTIHTLNYAVGYGKERQVLTHKGGGSVEIKCSNYDPLVEQ